LSPVLPPAAPLHPCWLWPCCGLLWLRLVAMVAMLCLCVCVLAMASAVATGQGACCGVIDSSDSCYRRQQMPAAERQACLAPLPNGHAAAIDAVHQLSQLLHWIQA
jgi:hypothetical protein